MLDDLITELESLNLEQPSPAIPKARHDQIAELKKKKGVYVLKYEDTNELYIGRSKNLGSRCWNHYRSQPPHEFIVLRYVDDPEERRLEELRTIAAVHKLYPHRLRNKKKSLKHLPKKKSIKQKALEHGVNPHTVYNRMRSGETLTEALTNKNRQPPKQTVEYEGKTYGVTELAKMLGVTYQALQYRIKRGMPLKDFDQKKTGQRSR